MSPRCFFTLAAIALGLSGCQKGSEQSASIPPPAATQPVAQVDQNAQAELGDVPATPPLPQTDEETRQAIATTLTASHRDAAARARDPWRHPQETLEFFGLRRDMTVIELWPGGGWYTDILAPVLATQGKLVVTGFDPKGPEDYYGTQQARAMLARLKDTKTYGDVEVRTVNPPQDVDLGPAESADMVLTFRNSHGWVRRGQEDKIYGEAYRVLKPGGILGVVQHRAAPGVTDVRKLAETGYVPEDYLVQKIESFGFRLVDKSEINANPKDTKDHPKGVWTLPPSYELGDKDREKYQAIGESDRMTLRFVKSAGQ